MRATDLRIDVHLESDAMATALRADVAVGLTATPKWLPPKWFYDDRGSELFDEITRLPEYYPTRRETEILEARSDEIVAAAAADTLVELGSGTSEKTLLLLDAAVEAGSLQRFVPFDVSEATLREAAERIDERYPDLTVHAVVGDFDRHLDRIPAGDRRLVAFLGGTIGNLDPTERARFLRVLGSTLGTGEHLLLGTDLVKSPERLVAAYDDAAGVTAEFNRNVLAVVNRELGADFEVDRFAHRAHWNDVDERIEMWLDATADMQVSVPELGLVVDFEEGEGMRTELSCKFTVPRVDAELHAAGFELVEMWTDDAGDFALSLGRRR